jgi:hypothetical protein
MLVRSRKGFPMERYIACVLQCRPRDGLTYGSAGHRPSHTQCPIDREGRVYSFFIELDTLMTNWRFLDSLTGPLGPMFFCINPYETLHCLDKRPSGVRSQLPLDHEIRSAAT